MTKMKVNSSEYSKVKFNNPIIINKQITIKKLTEPLKKDLNKRIDKYLNSKLDSYLKQFQNQNNKTSGLLKIMIEKKKGRYIGTFNLTIDGESFIYKNKESNLFEDPFDLVAHGFDHIKQQLSDCCYSNSRKKMKKESKKIKRKKRQRRVRKM